MKPEPQNLTREEREAKLETFIATLGRELLAHNYRGYEMTLPVTPGALRFTLFDASGQRHPLSGREHELACAMYDWAVIGGGPCPADSILSPSDWMFETALRIDRELGIDCRFDNTVTNAARIIAEQYLIALRRGLISSDDEMQHWWRKLSREQKADRLNLSGYERELFLQATTG